MRCQGASDEILQFRPGDLPTRKNCLRSPNVLKLFTRNKVRTCSSSAKAKQHALCSEEAENKSPNSAPETSKTICPETSFTSLVGAEKPTAMNSVWLTLPPEQDRAETGQQPPPRQERHHVEKLDRQKGGGGFPLVSMETPAIPLPRQQVSASSPCVADAGGKCNHSNNSKNIHFKCHPTAPALPAGPAASPPQGVGSSDAFEPQTRGNLLHSNMARKYNSQTWDPNALYSWAISSLATHGVRTPPHATGIQTDIACSAAVQHLKRQILRSLQQQKLVQYAKGSTSSAAVTQVDATAAGGESASSLPDLDAQHTHSGKDGSSIHSATFETGVTTARILLPATREARQRDEAKDAEKRTYQLKQLQLLRLAQPRLHQPERASTARQDDFLPKTGNTDKSGIRRGRAEALGGGSAADCISPSTAVKSNTGQAECSRVHVGIGERCPRAFDKQMQTATTTATLINAVDRLRELRRFPPPRSLVASQADHPEKERCCSKNRADSERNHDNLSSNVSDSSNVGSRSSCSNNSGSNDRGSNDSDVAAVKGKRSPPTFTAHCRSAASRTSKPKDNRVFEAADITSTKETLLLQYVKLLKTLLQDAAGGCRTDYILGSARGGTSEDTAPLVWKNHEANAATTMFSSQTLPVFQNEQKCFLSSGTAAPKTQQYETCAPHQQRLPAVPHLRHQVQQTEMNLSHLAHSREAQQRQFVNETISDSNECKSQCVTEAPAAVDTKSKEHYAQDIGPAVARNISSALLTAAAARACAEQSSWEHGSTYSDRLCSDEACPPERAAHYPDVVQLLRTNEYLRRFRENAALCERSKVKGVSASAVRQQDERSGAAVCERHATAAQERGSHAASDRIAPPSSRTQRPGDSFALPYTHTASWSVNAQEQRGLLRSKPLNPNAAPFIPRLSVALGMAAGRPPALTCRNGTTVAKELRHSAVSSSYSTAAAHEKAAWQEVWRQKQPPMEEQRLQHAGSPASLEKESLAATASSNAAQQREHQDAGVFLSDRRRNSDRPKQQQPSTTCTQQSSSLERCLEQLLLHYVQHQSPQAASSAEARETGGRKLVGLSRPSARTWNADLKPVNKPSSSIQTLQRATWVKEGETLSHLEVLLTQRLSKTTQSAMEVDDFTCAQLLRTPKAEENLQLQKEGGPGHLSKAAQRGSGLGDALVVNPQGSKKDAQDEIRSELGQSSADPVAALQRLLLYFRRAQYPEYFVARRVLQQLADSMRHPYSSPLPPALGAFSKVRPSSVPVSNEVITGYDDSLDVEGDAQAALATARTLLQATARKRVLQRAPGGVGRQAPGGAAALNSMKTGSSSQALVLPNLGAPVLSRLTEGESRQDKKVCAGEILAPGGKKQSLEFYHEQQIQQHLQQRQHQNDQEVKLSSTKSISKQCCQPAAEVHVRRADLLPHGRATVLNDGEDMRRLQSRPAGESEAQKLTFSATQLKALLRQLKHIHNHSGSRPTLHSRTRQELEQQAEAVLPRLPQECERPRVDDRTPAKFPLSETSVVPEEATKGAQSVECLSHRNCGRSYTKLELLQSLHCIKKRQGSSLARQPSRPPQSLYCEDNLSFEVIPYSRSQVDPASQHRMLHHQQQNRQQRQGEGEQQQQQLPAPTASDIRKTGRPADEQGNAFVRPEAGAHFTSVLPTTKPFRQSLSPCKAPDRLNPVKPQEYFLSPKSGSVYLGPSAENALTAPDEGAASDVSFKGSETQEDAEKTQLNVTSTAPPEEVSKAPANGSRTEGRTVECCVAGSKETQQSSCDGPSSGPAHAGDDRNTIGERSCVPSPASATCGSSRPPSVSSAHLVLERPAEMDGETLQPSAEKEEAVCDGNHQEAEHQPTPAAQLLQRNTTSETSVDQPEAATASWTLFAGEEALSPSAGDSTGPAKSKQQLLSLSERSSYKQPDNLSIQHGVRSTTATTPSSSAGDESLRNLNETSNRKESAASELTSSSSRLSSALLHAEQREKVEGAVQQKALREKTQQDVESLPQNTSPPTTVPEQNRLLAQPISAMPAEEKTAQTKKVTGRLSQLPWNAAHNESSTSGETPVSTAHRRFSAASGRAAPAVHTPASEDADTKVTLVSQALQKMTPPMEARSKYILIYKEKGKRDASQKQKLLSRRASYMPVTRKHCRLRQRPTVSGPEEVSELSRDATSARVHHTRKSTREARAAAPTRPHAALTMYTQVKKNGGGSVATEKKPEDTSQSTEGNQVCQNVKSKPRRSAQATQTKRNALVHALQSSQSSGPATSCLSSSQPETARAHNITDASAEQAEKGQPEGKSRKPEDRAKKLDSKLNKIFFVAENEVPGCKHVGMRHFGETATAETPDSSCSTTTAEVAPPATAVVEDRQQLPLLKQKAPSEQNGTESRTQRIPQRIESPELPCKKYETAFAKAPPPVTVKRYQQAEQRLCPLQTAEETGAALLTSTGYLKDESQSQKKNKQEKQLSCQSSRAQTPKKQQRREAAGLRERKNNVYVKREEQGCQDPNAPRNLPQQCKEDRTMLHVQQGKMKATGTTCSGSTQAPNTAALVNKKRAPAVAEHGSFKHTCEDLPTIHSETQSGERW